MSHKLATMANFPNIVSKLSRIASPSILLVFALYTIAAIARSVPENSLQGGQTNQKLVSNTRQGNSKAPQPSASFTSGNHNRCAPGWMWYNNKCWIEMRSRRDFSHAIDLCKRTHNSTLPTIHSEEENEFLRNNIHLNESPIWLYAKHNHQYNNTHWLDKSPVNFTRWDVGQPNDKSSLVCIKTDDSWYMKKAEPVGGQTECITFWEDGKWGTQVGCLVLLPVICEKKLNPVSRHLDGSNGSLTSQYEQQTAPISGGAQSTVFASRSTILPNLIVMIAVILLSNHKLRSKLQPI